MKKYRLLKDLPLYPTGTICEIKEEAVDPDGANGVWADVVMEVGKPYHWGEYVMNHKELSKIQEDGKFDEWFEEIEESKVWKPEYGEMYYFISGKGNVYSDRYSAGFDENYFAIGNCFETKEDAEKAVEKLKALRRLREKGLRFNHALRHSEKLADGQKNAGFITISFSNDVACQEDNPMKFDEETQRDLDLLFKEESEDEN